MTDATADVVLLDDLGGPRFSAEAQQIRDVMASMAPDCRLDAEALHAKAEGPGREAQAVELLEALPVLPEGLSSAPEEHLRRMFECFRLSVSYEKPTNWPTSR